MESYRDYLASKSQSGADLGVGSEVYSPVMLGRRGVGAELKEAYFRQAVKNVKAASEGYRFDRQNGELFA
jgi:hypothetical protein